jgi:hypothetical protein
VDEFLVVVYRGGFKLDTFYIEAASFTNAVDAVLRDIRSRHSSAFVGATGQVVHTNTFPSYQFAILNPVPGYNKWHLVHHEWNIQHLSFY